MSGSSSGSESAAEALFTGFRMEKDFLVFDNSIEHEKLLDMGHHS
jgi:hypothetical protein